VQIIDDNTKRFGRLLHYAGVLVTVVCVSAGYSFLHAPAVVAIADTASQIDDVKQSVQNAPIIRQQHKIASAKLHEVTTQIANVQRRVPREADSAEFLNELASVATAENLEISEFKPDDRSEAKNGYAEMQVVLKGKGSFGSICKFIDHLNKLARLTKVKDLTLSTDTDEPEYPMAATLVIYFALRGHDAAVGREAHGG
jgi:Tfp pilus assembly protein PilO